MAKEFSLVVRTVNEETTLICFNPAEIPDEKKPELLAQLKKAAGEIVIGTAYRISVRLSELNNGQIEIFVNPAIHNRQQRQGDRPAVRDSARCGRRVNYSGVAFRRDPFSML